MKEFEREIELIDYIEVVLKRKWLILLATLVGMAGGWALTEAPSPAFYEAKVILMIKSSMQEQKEDLKDTEVTPPSLSLDFYRSLALADDLRLALIDSLKLNRSPSSLDGVLEAEIVSKTGIELKVRSQDPAIPVPLVNAWAELFLERNRGLSVEALGSRYDWVVSQYEIARENLEAGEDSLNTFEAYNPVNFLQFQQTIYDSTHSELGRQLHALRLELQRKSFELKQHEETAGLIESESPFFFPGFPDSGTSPSSLPQTLRPDGMQMDYARKAKDKLIQEHQLALLQFDEEQRLAFIQFEKKHRFRQIQQELENLDTLVQIYKQMIVPNPEEKFFLQETRIEVLKEELDQHKPALKGSGDLNPVFLDLDQKLADERVGYETTRAISAGGKQRIKELEERLEEIRSIYHPLQLERMKLEYEFTHKRETFEHEFIQKKNNLDKKQESLQSAYDTAFETDWETFKTSKVAIATLRPVVQHLQREIQDLEVQLPQVQEQLKAIRDSISTLLLQSERLGRNQKIYEETFDRFSRLVEETRIAREKAAGDIQLLTRAVEPRLRSQGTKQQKALIGAAVGLMLSTVFAFLLEYVYKARQLRNNAGTVD